MTFCIIQNNTSSFYNIMSLLFSLNKQCNDSNDSNDSIVNVKNSYSRVVICCTEELRDEILNFHTLPSRISLDFYILEKHLLRHQAVTYHFLL